MTLPRLFAVSLLATACTPPEKSLGEGESGDADPTGGPTVGMDDGSAGTAGPGPDDGATSMIPGDDGASTGFQCPTVPPESCASFCDPCDGESVCVDGEWACDCACADSGSSTGAGDTGPTSVCEIVESACGLADQSKSDVVDCGDLTMEDPVGVWQAAHECALDQIAIQDGFKLVADVQGIDSLPRRAFVGVVAFAYQLVELDQDSGGFDPGPYPVWERLCDDVIATPGCTVAVGEICLQCVGDTDGDENCSP